MKITFYLAAVLALFSTTAALSQPTLGAGSPTATSKLPVTDVWQAGHPDFQRFDGIKRD